MPPWVLAQLEHCYGQIPLEVESVTEVIDRLDVIYVNRLQEERLPRNMDAATVRGSYLLKCRGHAARQTRCDDHASNFPVSMSSLMNWTRTRVLPISSNPRTQSRFGWH